MSRLARVARRVGVGAAFSALVGCAAFTGASADPVPAAPSSPPRPPPAAPDPVRASFRENLERARLDAGRAGWVVREVVELPEHHAALVLYDPSPGKAHAHTVMRVDAVGAGAYQVISSESGRIEVMRTRAGSPIWDLRGDGSRSVVLHLTPCGTSCGIAKPLVLELDGHSFRKPVAVPECPTCIRDEDGDGVPELERRLAALSVAPCSRASCGPASALLVEVRGVERWSRGRYAVDLALFAPLYRQRLVATERDADAVRRTADKARICPLNALSVAARRYVYGRLSGESAADALKAADRVMHGWDTRPCAKEYDLLAPPKPWAELRKELEELALPALEAR